LPPGFRDDQTSCSNCHDGQFRFSSVTAAAIYRDEARQAVLRMKFSGSHNLAIAVSQLFLLEKKSQLAQFAPTVVAPIPMHWTRRLWRGTNSAETIAEHLADGLNVPFASDLLVRTRKTQRQALLPPGRRLENVRDAFRARKGYDLTDLRVLLVDDVLTTGATCNEAARVLLAARAKAVAVAVIARALSWS
jgi:ComF family protein